MTTALFLLDAALDALMLLIAVRLCGGRVHLPRILCGALAGAAAALAARRFPLSGGQTALLWAPAALGMMAMACDRRALLHPVRSAALLLCAAGLLGGVVLSLYGATQSFTLAYGIGGVCTVCIAVMALRERQAAAGEMHLQVRCRYRGRLAAFDAMADSGNTLRDYLTHRPVIVMPEAQGRACFALSGAALRPIFADTAGGRQMMYCFSPEDVQLVVGAKTHRVRAAVALSPAMNRSAPALVPAALLWNEE